ncbi:protein C8orf37 homolog isoform X2 [Acanthaster planci]|uniref:Cilia- and flagella-associated protein 418 n=1 Tax=Acanthaster planci TaxID=133434 RepID=A0A8B7ZW00_ACAPL|nr:protein C8orf37 homolog isoform X2 [Acanthaster planci]
MADDIDDLLDEVETKFCAKSPVKKDSSSRRREDTNPFGSKSKKPDRESHPALSKKSSSKKLASEDDDLNSMIDDIIDGPEPPKTLQRQNSQTSTTPRTTSISQRRCNPVYLGGSADPMGLSSAVSQRMCDQLRCTSCDFKIVAFDNYEWDSTCEYLFFRNNVPDFKKLSTKLKKRKGCRAYACQCMWRSVKTVTKVEQDHQLKWVCGKHSL